MTPNLSQDEIVALGSKMVRPSVGLTVYLDRPLPWCREAVVRAQETFFARAESELKWYTDWKIGRLRPATGKLLRYPLQWLAEPDAADAAFGWRMFAADPPEDAPSYIFEGYSVEAAVEGPGPSYLSFMRIRLPLESLAPGYGRFIEFAAEIVSELPFHHGTGGFFFSESEQRGIQQKNSAVVFAAAMRFHGVEPDAPVTTSASLIEGIKTINWLTLVDDGFLVKLGGYESLRSRLSEEIVVHRLAHGVMIQAGKEPGFGDVNAGDRLPLYREVARVLKPIRTKSHPQLGDRSNGSFGDAGTAAWLSRFDD